MAAVTICGDFGAPPPQNKVSHCFHCFPIYLSWSDGTGCHDLLVLWMLSFKPAFSLSSFTFIKRLFSSSSLSAIRVVSSAYLRLLILLPAILIPSALHPVLFLVESTPFLLDPELGLWSAEWSRGGMSAVPLGLRRLCKIQFLSSVLTQFPSE